MQCNTLFEELIDTSMQPPWTCAIQDSHIGCANSSDHQQITKEVVVGTLCERLSSAQVHGGFLEAYDSVHAQVLRLVDDLTARLNGSGGWRILCTGHSLGSALATLLAYELADHRQAVRSSLACTLLYDPSILRSECDHEVVGFLA